MTSYACIVAGSLPGSDWRGELESGQRPRTDFSRLEQAGYRLFSRDPVPGRPAGILGRTFGLAYQSSEAALAHAEGGGGVYCVSEQIGIPLTALALARRSRARIIVGIHGHYFRNWKFKAWIAAAARSDRIRFACLSESLAQALVETFGVAPGKVASVGVAVDTAFFRPGPAGDPRLIVSAGAAGRDYATLVEAAGGLDLRVAIASGSTWIATAAAPEALPENVTMRSYGDYVRLRGLYAQSAAVVVPLQQTFHALGYAVMVEAMAMGKPVIATRTDAPSDFVLPGKTGLLVEPGDADGLRRAIAFMADHPDEAAAMGRAARDLMASAYSLDAFAARITGMFETWR